MAAGFTVREENIPALERRLRQLVLEERAGEELPSLLEIDAAVLPQELTVEAVEALDALEPAERATPGRCCCSPGLMSSVPPRWAGAGI